MGVKMFTSFFLDVAFNQVLLQLPGWDRAGGLGGKFQFCYLGEYAQDFCSCFWTDGLEHFRSGKQAFRWCAFGIDYLVLSKKKVKILDALGILVDENTGQRSQIDGGYQNFGSPEHTLDNL